MHHFTLRSRRRLGVVHTHLGLGMAGLIAWPAIAMANGNVSHQWVTHGAIDATPPGGSLHALVTDPALGPILDTGTMYPDWGYTPGATTDERSAGEASHWEPVQDAYRQWILETYGGPPWSDEARQHLAFYLGMSSHGIADQSYDSMFFERSRFYEPGDHSTFDQDTDVMWAATAGPGQAPRVWLPSDPLLDLFGEVVGVTIDEASMTQQVGFVGVAITAVGLLADDPVQVAAAEANYPWAAMHDDDPAIPGNPPHEAEIARRYWRSNWALLHGDALPRPVLWTHPVDGGTDHPVDMASIESWITIVFARGLEDAALSASQFHVTDPTGAELPIAIDLFYRDASHVVHLQPTADLLPDTVYVVTVDPGVATIHGESLEGWDFTFSTGNRAPPPLHDDGFWDEPDPYGDEPEGTTGDPDPTAGDTSSLDGTGTTRGGTGPGPTSTSTSAATDTAGTDGAGAGEDGASGCACTVRGADDPSWGGRMVAAWLWVVALRRRRACARRRSGSR